VVRLRHRLRRRRTQWGRVDAGGATSSGACTGTIASAGGRAARTRRPRAARADQRLPRAATCTGADRTASRWRNRVPPSGRSRGRRRGRAKSTLRCLREFLFCERSSCGLRIRFFLLAQDVGNGLDHVLEDGVAVFDKIPLFVARTAGPNIWCEIAPRFFRGPRQFVSSPPSRATAMRERPYRKIVCASRAVPLHFCNISGYEIPARRHIHPGGGQGIGLGANFFVDFILDGDSSPHRVRTVRISPVDVFFLDCDFDLSSTRFLGPGARPYGPHKSAFSSISGMSLYRIEDHWFTGARNFATDALAGSCTKLGQKPKKVSRFVR